MLKKRIENAKASSSQEGKQNNHVLLPSLIQMDCDDYAMYLTVRIGIYNWYKYVDGWKLKPTEEIIENLRAQKWENATDRETIRIAKSLRTLIPGKIVDITVWDGFSGAVKVLKRRLLKWEVEIVDVSMCYPQQVPFKPGERTWIRVEDLYWD